MWREYAAYGRQYIGRRGEGQEVSVEKVQSRPDVET